MIYLEALLEECLAMGVAIRLKGGRITLSGAPDAVSTATARLRPRKQELLIFLTTRPKEGDDVWGEFTPYVCPASVSPALIDELHRLIAQFSATYRLADAELARIKSAAMRQSAGSIADSAIFFKQAIEWRASGLNRSGNAAGSR